MKTRRENYLKIFQKNFVIGRVVELFCATFEDNVVLWEIIEKFWDFLGLTEGKFEGLAIAAVVFKLEGTGVKKLGFG